MKTAAELQKLAAPTIEGRHRCWVNDTPGRIAERLAAGYIHVVENGATKSRAVGGRGDGQPLVAFLLECSYETYQRQIGVLPPVEVSPFPATPYWEKHIPKEIAGIQAVNMTGREASLLLDYELELEGTRQSLRWRWWRLIHHAVPGYRFLGVFNWHKDAAWFRLIFRPVQNWHVYMRLCWRPRWKVDFEIERRGF